MEVTHLTTSKTTQAVMDRKMPHMTLCGKTINFWDPYRGEKNWMTVSHYLIYCQDESDIDMFCPECMKEDVLALALLGEV